MDLYKNRCNSHDQHCCRCTIKRQRSSFLLLASYTSEGFLYLSVFNSRFSDSSHSRGFAQGNYEEPKSAFSHSLTQHVLVYTVLQPTLCFISLYNTHSYTLVGNVGFNVLHKDSSRYDPGEPRAGPLMFQFAGNFLLSYSRQLEKD